MGRMTWAAGRGPQAAGHGGHGGHAPRATSHKRWGRGREESSGIVVLRHRRRHVGCSKATQMSSWSSMGPLMLRAGGREGGGTGAGRGRDVGGRGREGAGVGRREVVAADMPAWDRFSRCHASVAAQRSESTCPDLVLRRGGGCRLRPTAPEDCLAPCACPSHLLSAPAPRTTRAGHLQLLLRRGHPGSSDRRDQGPRACAGARAAGVLGSCSQGGRGWCGGAYVYA